MVKSEPDSFGWDQQVKNGVEPWTGVRNHMARNNLRAMRLGDLAFFYHSNVGREIVGVVRVARKPTPTRRQGRAIGSASTWKPSARSAGRSRWRR